MVMVSHTVIIGNQLSFWPGNMDIAFHLCVFILGDFS